MSKHAKPDFYEPLSGVRVWRRRKGYDFVCPARVEPLTVRRAAGERAPDYVEPVVAWRVWRVIRYHDVHLLASPLINVVWPSRAALEAACLQWAGGRHDQPSPYERCSCGIYGARLESLPLSMLSPQLARRTVVGRVSLWGDVVEGETGWRAGRAYPKELFVPLVGNRPSSRQLHLVEALGHYGVPVEPVRVRTRADLIDELRAVEARPLAQAA